MGTLYLVATPIGNLEDLTLRAIRILKQVPLIAAEDTRTARKLLSHLDIHTPITSYFEHNEEAKLDAILSALEAGDVAVISEAGMPGLSDPGAKLVQAAIAHEIRVVPIPGANAVIIALVASGLPTDQFVYLGFLPRERKPRRALLESVAHEMRTLVAFESPHRVREALADIEKSLGNRSMCVARELTKLHEEFLRGRVSELSAHFEANEPRGEFTLVIAGAETSAEAKDRVEWTDTDVRIRLEKFLTEGLTPTEAAKRVAREAGWERRVIYQMAVEHKRKIK